LAAKANIPPIPAITAPNIINIVLNFSEDFEKKTKIQNEQFIDFQQNSCFKKEIINSNK